MRNLVREVLKFDQWDVIQIKDEIGVQKSPTDIMLFIKESYNIDLFHEQEYVAMMSKNKQLVRILGYNDDMVLNLCFSSPLGNFKPRDDLPQALMQLLLNDKDLKFFLVYEPVISIRNPAKLALELRERRNIDAFREDIALVYRVTGSKEMRVIRFIDGIVVDLRFVVKKGWFKFNNELDGLEPETLVLSSQNLCEYFKTKTMTIIQTLAPDEV